MSVSAKRAGWFGAAALVLTIVVVARWPAAGDGPAMGLVLITIDTLRADYVGAYGATAVRTPHLDSIASAGTRFSAAYATVPLTLPSHLSMLSGQLPVEHTVRTNDGYRVPDAVPLVAETLRQAGYRTGAVVGTAVLRRATGIGRGFEQFDDELGGKGERRGEEVVRRATEWVRAVGDQKFFLWVHLNDPHLPYNAPEPFASTYAGNPYAAEVAYADDCVGRLIEALQTLGLAKRTALVVAADHGEGLGDHGEQSHGALLYDSTIHVPLLVSATANAPRVNDAPVSTSQIAPTLLELAGLKPVGVLDSLLATPRGDEPVAAETLYLAQQLGWSPIYAARIGHLKIIDAPAPQVYDLAADPLERSNLASQNEATLDRARDRLRHELAAAGNRSQQPVRLHDNGDARQQLAALGYVSGGRLVTGLMPVSGSDPSERIGEWSEVEHGLRLGQEHDRAGAARVFQQVFQQDPSNVLALKFLGADALDRGDLKTAIRMNVAVVASGLHQSDALSNLCLAYARAGDFDLAVKNGREAHRLDPDHRAALTNLVLALSAQGSDRARKSDPSGAVVAFREANALAPTNVEIAAQLAAALHQDGHTIEARTLFESIVSTAPNRPEPQLSLAIIDLEEGRLPDAVRRLERIRSGWPGAFRAEFYLGETYRRQGDRAAARTAYESCLRQAPPGDPVIPAARRALQFVS